MVFNKIFGSGKLRKPLDLSFLKTDMHSHLIPGIDDGAPDIDASLKLAKQLKELGYKKIITTPHIQQEFYKNTPDIIHSGLDKVRESLKSNGIDIDIEAAAEYLIDDGFEEKAKNGNLMSFGDKYVLVELSYYNPHPNLKEIVFKLQVDGYKVVMAHPERYSYWFNDWKKFTELKDRGVFFQLNIVSLAGYYPEPVRKFAHKLIDEGMIEFAGSDTHNDRYMVAMRNAAHEKYLEKLLKGNKLLNSTL
jgi:tyrosine-protein phosphatase YwqE